MRRESLDQRPERVAPRHPLDQRAEERAIPMATLTTYDDLAPGA